MNSDPITPVYDTIVLTKKSFYYWVIYFWQLIKNQWNIHHIYLLIYSMVCMYSLITFYMNFFPYTGPYCHNNNFNCLKHRSLKHIKKLTCFLNFSYCRIFLPNNHFHIKPLFYIIKRCLILRCFISLHRTFTICTP